MTVTPTISEININYQQNGIYQVVGIGKGLAWECYPVTDTQTAFVRKSTDAPVPALIQMLPLK